MSESKSIHLSDAMVRRNRKGGGHSARRRPRLERREKLPELTAEDIKWLKLGVGIGNGRWRVTGSRIIIHIKGDELRFQPRRGVWFRVTFEPETPRRGAVAALLEYLFSWRTGEAKQQSEGRNQVEVRRDNTIRILGNPEEVVETLRALLAPQHDRRSREEFSREPVDLVSETEHWSDLRPIRG